MCCPSLPSSIRLPPIINHILNAFLETLWVWFGRLPRCGSGTIIQYCPSDTVSTLGAIFSARSTPLVSRSWAWINNLITHPLKEIGATCRRKYSLVCGHEKSGLGHKDEPEPISEWCGIYTTTVSSLTSRIFSPRRPRPPSRPDFGSGARVFASTL